jgi:putative membrane protein
MHNEQRTRRGNVGIISLSALAAVSVVVLTSAQVGAAHAVNAVRGADALTDANILANEEGGDSAEVVVATLAARKATDPAVRSYADMLIRDHSKSLKEVKEVAAKVKIHPEPPPSDTTAQMTRHLVERFDKLAKGTTFDTAFVNHEVEDHQHDIAEAKEMESQAKNAQVKAEVRKSLPVLEKHLRRAEQLASKKK